MTAASTATKHLTDNRAVICGKDDTAAPGVRIAILPTLPDGLMFVAKDTAGADITGETAATTTVPAYISNANVGRVIVPIDFATRVGPGASGGSKYVRTQVFTRSNVTTGVTTTKTCYVNLTGWPLKADGTKALADLSDAADAKTTPLTAVGEAVTNYSQPGPLPGTYWVSELQQGYAPYLAWTVKAVGYVNGAPV